MTLKQQIFLSKLPENKFNISKTMKQSGYSDSSCLAGSQYQSLRRLTNKKFFDEEFIRKQYKNTLKEAETQKDLTNKLRCLEGMARLEALFTDKSQIKTDSPTSLNIIYTNKETPTENKQVNNNTPTV